jgi:hypothetical protein
MGKLACTRFLPKLIGQLKRWQDCDLVDGFAAAFSIFPKNVRLCDWSENVVRRGTAPFLGG